MTDDLDTDPLELLRRANPYRLADVRGAGRAPAAIALREAIIMGERVDVAPRRWSRERFPLREPLTADPLIERLRSRNPQPTAELAGAGLSFTARRTFALIVATPRSRWVRFGLWITRRSDDQSLIGLLARANPVPASSVAGSRESLRAEMLFDAIIAGRREVPVPSRRRRLAVAFAVVTAVAASAAGYALAQRPVTTADAIVCYQTASLSANKVYFDATGGSPTSVCEQHVWLTGAFGPPRVHHLVACVLSTGNYGVFPGRTSATVCARLHLATPLPPSSEAVAAAQLRNELDVTLRPESCVSQPDAVALARSKIAALHLTGWTVVTGSGSSSTRPCTQALVDLSERRVIIEPFVRVPPRPSGSGVA